jgi:hypothetical protein
VTDRTGYMGNTFPLSGGGVDAVEGVFGNGGAPAVCRSAADLLVRSGLIGLKSPPTEAADLRALIRFSSVAQLRLSGCGGAVWWFRLEGRDVLKSAISAPRAF